MWQLCFCPACGSPATRATAAGRISCHVCIANDARDALGALPAVDDDVFTRRTTQGPPLYTRADGCPSQRVSCASTAALPPRSSTGNLRCEGDISAHLTSAQLGHASSRWHGPDSTADAYGCPPSVPMRRVSTEMDLRAMRSEMEDPRPTMNYAFGWNSYSSAPSLTIGEYWRPCADKAHLAPTRLLKGPVALLDRQPPMTAAAFRNRKHRAQPCVGCCRPQRTSWARALRSESIARGWMASVAAVAFGGKGRGFKSGRHSRCYPCRPRCQRAQSNETCASLSFARWLYDFLVGVVKRTDKPLSDLA